MGDWARVCQGACHWHCRLLPAAHGQLKRRRLIGPFKGSVDAIGLGVNAPRPSLTRPRSSSTCANITNSMPNLVARRCDNSLRHGEARRPRPRSQFEAGGLAQPEGSRLWRQTSPRWQGIGHSLQSGCCHFLGKAEQNRLLHAGLASRGPRHPHSTPGPRSPADRCGAIYLSWI